MLILHFGAEPFLFLDYYATGGLDVDVAAEVITGIAHGCELAGCSLAGGETAEMPGFYAEGEYDLAGFCVGVVDRSEIIDGSQVQLGDAVVGLASSGPHSNGYSLIRKVLETQGMSPNDDLLDELLAPTRIYVKPVLDVLRNSHAGYVHAMVHITGGGFFENIPRVLNNPEHGVSIDLDSWQWPEVFAWMQQAGKIEQTEMLTTFNCGIGFMLVVDEAQADSICGALTAAGESASIIGQIVPANTQAEAGTIVVTK